MEHQQEPQSFRQPPKPSVVAVVPSPGMGHLIPLVEFAKRLVRHHELRVTFIIPSSSSSPSTAHQTVLQALPSSIDHIFLPPVSLKDLPEDFKIEAMISLTVLRSLPSLRDTFATLTTTSRLVALVVDLFGTDAFDVAAEFDVSPCLFFPSTAMSLSLCLRLPQLDQEVQCQYTELAEPLRLPGCVPIHAKDLLDPLRDRNNEAYKYLLHNTKRYRLAEGILLNSFMGLETGAVTALLKEEPEKPFIYPVGPLVNTDPVQNSDEGCECLKWLDEQPHGSVLFVSFGSGGTLSSAQMNELAMGLENSEHRFLWVVRSPNDKVSNATYFGEKTQTDPLDFLPKGFLGRTRGRGLVVPSWAPQAQVLSHGSTGGFLTHCGWNSILETVVNGLPMIAWPLYAEQKMNAVMLTQDVKIALRPQANGDGLIGKDEIANVVKVLMESEEGKWLRNKTKDLKDAAARVLTENGSSTQAISQFALKFMNRKS